MLKKKFSYEKSINIILNDEYKDNIILMHHDDLEETSPSSLTSSRLIANRPQRKLNSSQGHQFSGNSSMKRIQNKKNIFDEDSMDMEDIRKPSNRNLVSRRSVKEINQEMRIKEQQRKEKAKGKVLVNYKMKIQKED
jgi:hypothetical protein